jgi:two-component system, LytTR family, response regulator
MEANSIELKNNFKVVIVDDEESGINVIRLILENYFKHVEIIGVADNIEAAIQIIEEKQPNVLFLDVQMPDGGGFELLKRIDSSLLKVIFVTGFEEYALQAIKASALDYLLKPASIADIGRCLEKVEKAYNEKFSETNNHNYAQRRMIVHHNDKVKLLDINEIVNIEAQRSYADIVLASGTRITTAKPLSSIEVLLQNFLNFVRINKSCIVNINYVSEYSKGEPCFLILKDQRDFEISRRKKSEINDLLKRIANS